MKRRQFAQFPFLVPLIPPVLAQHSAAGKRARMYAMASESLFVGVNRTDAVASLRIWAEALSRRLGFDFDIKLDVFGDPNQALQRLKAETVDLLFLDTPDYAAVHGSGLIEPVGAGSHRGMLGKTEYMLLCREGSGTEALPDLRGKRIGIASRTGAGLGAAWLNTLLASDGVKPGERFFGSVSAGTKASACVLPVFFGRLDACIVDGHNFATMKELNPQLSRLKVLAHSEPMLEGMIALSVVPHSHRSVLIEALYQLHQDPAGAQIVMLFRTGPIVRATADDFESSRVTWERSRRSAAVGTGVTAHSSGGGR